MPPALPLSARVVAQASVVRSLVALIQEPTADKVLGLEKHITRLATDADVDKYLAALRACPATARMMEERYLPEPYTLDDLERCAPGTLGHAYRRHMVDNDLRPDYFDRGPLDRALAAGDRDADFAYARLRMYQTHDLWHAVTGYSTTVLGEVGIVGFYMGHFERHMGDRAGAASAFSAILAGTMVLHGALFRQDRIPHFFRALVEGYERGRAASPFFAVRWEQQWDRPLADVRRELGVTHARDAEPAALAA
ncbi:MAG: Coq4 family protein [Sandaracinus sp.]